MFKCNCHSHSSKKKTLILKAQSKVNDKKVKQAKDVMEVADRNEVKLIGNLKQGLIVFKRRIKTEDIEGKLSADSPLEVEQVIPWERLENDMNNSTLTQLAAMEQAAQKTIKVIKPPKNTLRFDAKNPNVKSFIANTVGERIVEVKEQGQRAVQRMAMRSLNQGLTPKRAAKLIKGSVGLTEKQSELVMNYHSRMLAERTSLQRRLATLTSEGKAGSKRFLAIKTKLRGLTDSAIDRKLAQRIASAEKNRRLAIARTELTRTVNEAQNQMWTQAVNDGLAPPDTDKVWVAIIDQDTTDICLNLDGQRVKVGEKFYVPETGESVDGPPSHINCRSGLAFEQPEE